MRILRRTNRLTFITLGVISLSLFGCASYQPFSAKQFSWQWNETSADNPVFVEAYDHTFLWAVLVDVVDSHFEIAREMPIRLYGNVLTEGHIETKPKIGASLPELWHADSADFQERMHCTLQTIRRRVEVHAVPETGGYTIEVKVFKELEDNDRTLQSQSGTASLRFKEDVSQFSKEVDVNTDASGWFIIERDTAMEERLLLEILYRLQNPSEIIRKSKEPMRG
ncbi:MAG: hypothetical protein LBT46_05955 [Planctomycetaceae bacterium]|jgi:hypothetical protein|nr:hypothetical protein [Planctomycetaceae bacterium]